MYATAIYLGAAESLDSSTRDLLRWLGLLVATPVVLYSARPFFAGALRSLAARRVGMDVPVALAIAAVYAASLIEAVRGTGEVYFDSVSMFVFFLLAGRYLEMRARHHARDLTDALARLTPPFAERAARGRNLQACRHPRTARGRSRARGGRRHRAGRRRAADRALPRGRSAAQRRVRPVTKRRDDPLIAGSVLEDGPVLLRVERVGADTALAGIAALVGRAHAERPRLQVVGELAAGRFVARVLTLTAITAAVWAVVDPARAFPAAVAVLVISCPCAFALAVPAALTRALGAMARRGVLVVKPDGIQALAECTHALFDKTGTLTEATLSLGDVRTFDGVSHDAALRLAATLARQSRHPVARAIAAAYPGIDAAAVRDVATHAGARRERDDRRAHVAPRPQRFRRWPASRWRASSRTPCCSPTTAGRSPPFASRERLRPEACAAIEALQAQGHDSTHRQRRRRVESRRHRHAIECRHVARAPVAGGKTGLGGGAPRDGRTRARGG